MATLLRPVLSNLTTEDTLIIDMGQGDAGVTTSVYTKRILNAGTTTFTYLKVQPIVAGQDELALWLTALVKLYSNTGTLLVTGTATYNTPYTIAQNILPNYYIVIDLQAIVPSNAPSLKLDASLRLVGKAV